VTLLTIVTDQLENNRVSQPTKRIRHISFDSQTVDQPEGGGPEEAR